MLKLDRPEFVLAGELVWWVCHNKVLQTQWFKTVTHMYCLIVLGGEVQNQGLSNILLSLKPLEKDPLISLQASGAHALL